MLAAITEFQTVENPDRHELGGWQIKFKRGSTVLSTINKAVDAPSASYSTTLTPGSYTATAQRLSNLGSPIGPLVESAPLVVAGPGSFEAPLTVVLGL